MLFAEELGCGHRYDLGFADGDGPRPFTLPGDQPRWGRDRTVDIRHIKLELSFDLEARKLFGVCTTTFSAIVPGVDALTLDAADLTVHGILSDTGEALPFDLRDHRLTIRLPRTLTPGRPFTVVIAYDTTPRRGLYFNQPDPGYPDRPTQIWTQSQDEDARHWFPCFDYPNERCTSEIVAQVPASWFVLSNGRLQSRGRARPDGARTYHWVQDQPHVTYLMSLVAGEFSEIRARGGDAPVLFYCPPGREADARRAFGKTPAMIDFFSAQIGVPYPWAKYATAAVADFIFGGMENTSCTTMTDRLLHDARAHLDYDADGITAHELAHQWFGDLLTCRDWSHGWLNEGFATYFDALFTEHDKGLDEFRWQLRQNTEIYLKETRERYRRAIVTNVYHEPIDLFDRHLYEKASLVLHMLRTLLGDDLWWAAINRYVRDHRDGTVTTADFEAAINRATGKELRGFFHQWVHQAGHPEFTVSWSYDDRTHQTSVTVTQTQTVDELTPLFRLPVVIDFQNEQEQQAFTVEVAKREQTFILPLSFQPLLCRFDPGGNVLKTLKFDRPKEQLLFALARDRDVNGRADAAAALGKLVDPTTLPALQAAVQSDPFWGVAAAAAKALGAFQTEPARAALVACLRVPHPKVRRAVVAALGEFRHDETAAAALAPLAHRDPSYFVEAAAVQAIAKIRSRDALRTIRAALRKPSVEEVIRDRALRGLADLRDPAGIDLALQWTRWGRPQPARVAAVAALAQLIKADVAPARKSAVVERLCDLLKDRWLRVRLAAIAGLRTIGDARAIAPLETSITAELDGRGIRAAREALAALRGGGDKREITQLRDDLEELRQANALLRGRLDHIEAAGR